MHVSRGRNAGQSVMSEIRQVKTFRVGEKIVAVAQIDTEFSGRQEVEAVPGDKGEILIVSGGGWYIAEFNDGATLCHESEIDRLH